MRGRYTHKARPVEDRFWPKVKRGDGCWEWQASTTGGYGVFYDGVAVRRAHRVSWTLAHPGTSLSSTDFICHKCDNRRCVRPDHLFLGDVQANYDDMVAKGRRVDPPKPRGERHAAAVMTDAMVMEARARVAAGGNQVHIAREMGVKRSTLNKAVRGLNYVYLPNPCGMRVAHIGARMITIDGITMMVSEWARKVGLSRGLISQRLSRGWSDRDAVLTPVVAR